MDIIKFRTPYDRAEKAGQECLKQAKEEHSRRQEYGKKESYQACKEAATYLVHQKRGRVLIKLNDMNMDYERVFGHS